jgi:hypothetical protein
VIWPDVLSKFAFEDLSGQAGHYAHRLGHSAGITLTLLLFEDEGVAGRITRHDPQRVGIAGMARACHHDQNDFDLTGTALAHRPHDDEAGTTTGVETAAVVAATPLV